MLAIKETREAKQFGVVVVDDDVEMRKGISRLLRVNGIDTQCFACGEEFLKCGKLGHASCLILDLQLPGIDGIDLQEQLLSEGGPPVVFISGCGSVSSSVAAMKGGAVDFLEKPFSERELLDAIGKAVAHGAAVKMRMQRLKKARQFYDRLTDREKEVMAGVAQGLLNKQIAYEFGISEKTIKVHRGRVMEKMEVESVAELVRLADLLESSPSEMHPHGSSPCLV